MGGEAPDPWELDPAPGFFQGLVVGSSNLLKEEPSMDEKGMEQLGFAVGLLVYVNGALVAAVKSPAEHGLFIGAPRFELGTSSPPD